LVSVQATILVVDDNDAGRFAKSAMLRRAGFSVLDAATGRDALDIISRHLIDLVVLDINLPDMSGLDVCAQIKADPRFATIQVLHISATAIGDEDKIRGLEGGADAYLAEPAHHDVVVATLNALSQVLPRLLHRARDLGEAVTRQVDQEEPAGKIEEVDLARMARVG
jgi:DNA-binding response OmpR family regulator